MRDRRVVAAAAFVVQMILGTVYDWSVFSTPLMDRLGMSRAAVNAIFTITLATVGITAAFGGLLQSRYGPRRVVLAAGIVHGLGISLSGLTHTAVLLYMTHGLLVGIGIGIGYTVPVSLMIGWFPERVGFVAGLTAAGFGTGALLVCPVAMILMSKLGLSETLVVLGLTYMTVVVSVSTVLRSAPARFADGLRREAFEVATGPSDFSLTEALQSRTWYVLWLMMTLNVMAGAAVISIAAPMAQSLTGASPQQASIVVISIGAGNIAGRLFWGSMSDRLGRPATFMCLFVIQFFAFSGLAVATTVPALLLCTSLISSCFGAGFAIMPALVTDYFGKRHAGTIFGGILTAWSAGAIAGTTLISTVAYGPALWTIAFIMLGSLILPINLLIMTRTVQAQRSSGSVQLSGTRVG